MNKRYLYCALLLIGQPSVSMPSGKRLLRRMIHTVKQRYARAASWIEENPDTVSLISRCAGIAACCYGYWYWWIRVPFQRKMYGNQPMDLLVRPEREPRVQMVQLRVTQQRGAACGLYAVHNGTLIAHALHNGAYRDLESNLFDVRRVSEWCRALADQGNWVRSTVLEERMDALGAPIPYGIIEDIATVGTQDFDVCTPAIIDGCRQAEECNQPYTHICFVNTALQSRGDERGHWFALVMHQDREKKRIYTVADSLNTGLLFSDHVSHIIETIECDLAT